MVASIRSALLICAAMSASSVAPAQVAPAGPAVVQTASVSPSAITRELLLKSDQLAVPVEENSPVDADTQDESAPEVDRHADLPTLVAQLRSAEPGNRQLECLAAGIYFESKGEPLAGQLAVGDVIANRADSSRFPDSYCSVILQRGQFSFVHHGRWPHIRRDSKSWKTAVAIATIVDRDLKDSTAEDALFFHARRVKPGWHKKRVASIGNHIFFR